MTLIKEYLDLTNKFIDEFGNLSIVLMQNGAFFESYGLKDTDDNVFGCRIVDFSKICDLNIVDKKVPGGSNMMIDGFRVVNAGFKTHLLEKYLKKLQEYGFTIIVYEEEGSTPDPVTGRMKRYQSGIYSPGTYFSDLDNDKVTNNICCLWIDVHKSSLNKASKKMVYMGTSIIDIYTGFTCINENSEEYFRNPTTFDTLERLISVYNPSETIIVSNLDDSEIKEIINFINLKSKTIHIVSLVESNNTNTKNIVRALNCEKQTYQAELLNKFYKISDMSAFMGIFYENTYATQSFCFLLDFVYQHNPHLIKNIAEPILESNNDKMILANHSLKQLNIIDDDTYKGKYSSVVKMLNECLTSMGRRFFNSIFLSPVTDIKYLELEYEITDYLLNNKFDENYTHVKQMLYPMKDLSKIMRQIILQKASPKMLYYLYQGAITTKRLHSFFTNISSKSSSSTFLFNYFQNKITNFHNLIPNIDKLTNYLDKVLYIDLCQDIDNIQKIEDSFIKNDVDPILNNKIQLLMDSKDQLNACRNYLSSLVENYETNSSSKKTTKSKKKKVKNEDTMNDDTNISNDNDDEDDAKYYVKIHETEKNNFSLLATERRCKIIEELLKNKSDVIINYKSSYTGLDTSFVLSLNLEYVKQSKTSKIITNSQIETLCKNVSQIKIGLIDLVTQVYKDNILMKMMDFQNEIESIINFVTIVDVIMSKAFIADKYNYCKPLIRQSEHSFIDVKDLRHCLIEKIQQTELYVANDISIGSNGILLYGTNAVGKTSLIRALGISIIMAQAGLYVPASRFMYYPYKYIFTRILGNDNIFKGLSRFAVEMSELRTILRLANSNSLVLGDELCSGTESISATSIFVEGIRQLSAIGCSFIFATHLHEIISYDEITSLKNVCMKHMSVIYDKEKDCLIYNRKLQDGPGTSMYGLEVCKSLNLPQDFLENAIKIRMKYHPEMSSVLDQKQSHFNAKHIAGGICEKCGIKPAVDVHHLIFQNEANSKGVIKKKGLTFDKNNKANITNLCEDCHTEVHKEKKTYKKTKTTIGIILEEV